MNKLYSMLIAIAAFLLFTVLAAAMPVPTWDTQINDPTRFTVLDDFNGVAVLDNETGLVWEQSPTLSQFNWLDAHVSCNIRVVGNRNGWRLPTVQELASLVDSTQSNPSLPSGHPFSNVQSASYWSATTRAGNPSAAWDLIFVNGGLGFADKTFQRFVWCVRGGQGVDPQ